MKLLIQKNFYTCIHEDNVKDFREVLKKYTIFNKEVEKFCTNLGNTYFKFEILAQKICLNDDHMDVFLCHIDNDDFAKRFIKFTYFGGNTYELEFKNI